MNVAVRDMMGWGPWWRTARRAAPATSRRKPVAPVTRSWDGVAAALRAALIMASGLVLAGVLGWLWATFTDPRTLPIRHLEVQGPFAHVDDQALRAAVAPYLKGNFFTVDVRQVQRAVEGLPWVRAAEVRRVWPGGVHIAVREQVATAQWGDDALVNEAGEVFRPPYDSYPAGLPRLRGPDGAGKAVVTAFRDMSDIIRVLGVHITAVQLDRRRAWTVGLDNGMELVLGRGDGHARLLRFVRFYRRALEGREARVQRVDLRYSNGFAVSWKGDAPTNKEDPRGGERATR